MTGPNFDPSASVIVIPRQELSKVRKEELSPSKAYILVDTSWTAQNLWRALSTFKGVLFMDCSGGVQEMRKTIQLAPSRQTEKERQGQLMQMMRLQNRQIEELNRGP